MNYKKHKEDLEAAKGWLAIAKENNNMIAIQILEKFFPELKESEDERIRKGLIEHLKELKEQSVEGSHLKRPEHYDTWISWLEKKGEKKPTPKFKIGDTIHKIGENTVFPRTIEKIEDGCYVCNNSRSRSFIFIKFQDDYELVEHKLVDEYEPKFKVGDWITNGEYTWKVTDIKPLDYILQSPNGNTVDDTISHVNEYFHLWTIQDAKNGDVLYFSDETIAIFKDLYSANTFHSYCNIENNVFDNIPDWWAGKGFQPATKEQRELLFQKMKEAGYEWDAEKKGLRTIE